MQLIIEQVMCYKQMCLPNSWKADPAVLSEDQRKLWKLCLKHI